MNFGERIRKVRTDEKLTQEQMSEKLNISRQAVSNWENNRNLPDIEMLITIAKVFNISLDQLILGGNDMDNMTEKLIKDGNEKRRAKINMISIILGLIQLVIGSTFLFIKSISVEYVDASGVLRENFFLIPLAFLFLFTGCITFLVICVRNLIIWCPTKFKSQEKSQ